jgi:hypothetical protein
MMLAKPQNNTKANCACFHLLTMVWFIPAALLLTITNRGVLQTCIKEQSLLKIGEIVQTPMLAKLVQ